MAQQHPLCSEVPETAAANSLQVSGGREDLHLILPMLFCKWDTPRSSKRQQQRKNSLRSSNFQHSAKALACSRSHGVTKASNAKARTSIWKWMGQSPTLGLAWRSPQNKAVQARVLLQSLLRHSQENSHFKHFTEEATFLCWVNSYSPRCQYLQLAAVTKNSALLSLKLPLCLSSPPALLATTKSCFLLLPAFSLLRARGTPVLQKEGGCGSHPTAALAPPLYSKHAATFLLTLGDRKAATGINRHAEAQQRVGILFSLYQLKTEGVNCSSHSHDTEAGQRNRMFTKSSRTALLSSLAGLCSKGHSRFVR